jgi:GNAT superfamily N-acetyltransferase
MNVNIMEKTSEEFHQVVELLKLFAKDHEMGVIKAPEDPTELACKVVYDVSENGKLYVAKNESGKTVGSLGLKLGNNWYSEQKFYGDLWFYVLPEYRSSGVGGTLLTFAKNAAQAESIPLVVGVFNLQSPEKKIEIYKRLGFSYAGSMFVSGV